MSTSTRTTALVTTLLSAAVCSSSPQPAPAPARTGATGAGPMVFGFDADSEGGEPAGFTFGRTGKGAPGRWVVVAEAGAPSGGKVLAQVDADRTDLRFPVAVATEPVAADVAVSVRCKMISGKVDQACGLVVRYVDEDDYYVVRANALENNIRFYHVVAGRRTMTASWAGRVTAGTWHQLEVELRDGEPGLVEARVRWDGTVCFVSTDKKYFAAGRVGLWTKADSVTRFDDLRITGHPGANR